MEDILFLKLEELQELEQKDELTESFKTMDRIIEVKAVKNFKPAYEAFQDTTVWNEQEKIFSIYPNK